MAITISLLTKEMQRNEKVETFLLDGFPRAIDQGLAFESALQGRLPDVVICLECPEEESLERVLKRGLESGRSDDNHESFRRRFDTYRRVCRPVVEHYKALGVPVWEINTGGLEVEVIYTQISQLIEFK